MKENNNIIEGNKHILVKQSTKKRVGMLFNKEYSWDDGIRIMCDFIDKNKESFDEFKRRKECTGDTQ